MGCVEEVSHLLTEWEDEDSAGRDTTSILTKLAEIFELETEEFLKKDPDPFDDRHPSRSQPDCTLGHMLKAVFRNPRIVNEIVKVYCQRDVVELNTASCRFLLDILPGLESIIFQEEAFVLKLFHWAEKAPNPLQTYATGLLAAAMEVPEIASSYREKNAYFVPLMLRRLYDLSKNYLQHTNSDDNSCITMNMFGVYRDNKLKDESSPFSEGIGKTQRKPSRRKKDGIKSARFSPMFSEIKSKEKKSSLKIPPVEASMINESSNSNWTEFMFGSYQVFPLTLEAQQRYILQYLTPMGEYQELIGHVFEENALLLILKYIDLTQNHDVRLAFEALKYLSSLLCHKKIAIEFLNIGGLQLLLKVPRPSIAATGVSICLYYLGYLEEAIEKICLLPSSVISNLVKYALWLLEASHSSSRCHATLFFGFGLAYKVILQHFDQQDGLRKLFNVMSTLDIFVSTNNRTLSDDDIFGCRLTTRHVCGSLKRYFEVHLAMLVEEKHCRSDNLDIITSRAASFTSEVVESNIETLHDLGLTPLVHWKPVNEFVNLDGVTFLLELISSYFKLSYSGRAETVKNAMDVLKICALAVPAQLKLCEKITSPVFEHITGISVILQAAEAELIPVPDVQRSALQAIINCVCSKIPGESSSRTLSTPKRKVVKNTEDLLNKVWKAVRIKNGIIVLINLLTMKMPHTDADSIRALACKALCGLARSETVKQIISKLPLVSKGQLIDLMKEPVLQDKYHDHVQFCKYGLELIERVTGAPVAADSESSLNLNKLCVSEVVSKTKVFYNEYQLLLLIRDHLVSKGFTQTASCLQKEVEQKFENNTKSSIFFDAFPSTVHTSMSRLSSKTSHLPIDTVNKFSSISSPVSSVSAIPPPSVPLKIILNKKVQSPDIRSPKYRLQKPQICSGSYVQSPAILKMERQSAFTPYNTSQSSISLDTIITEYLRKQHSLCKNPMLACPPFDLFTPHKCPEAQFKRNAPVNCVLRLQQREIGIPNGGYGGATANTKHIYSRFRLYRTCRDEEGLCEFTTCAFFNNSEEAFPKIIIGSLNGKARVYNVNTAKEIYHKNCHLRGLAHIESRKGTPLLITSNGGRVGTSALWNFASNMDTVNMDLLHTFYEVCHMEFGKRSVERVIGTKNDAAVIYDTATFAELQSFPVATLGNCYVKNRATFDYSDELVLTDGLIYDVRSGKLLHKLDKFNSFLNGVFHPNGREIISNSEIWDIRTFKLLRTVAGLDQCRVNFNHLGNVIYGVSFENINIPMGGSKTCFYTFDAFDYNTIATVNVKKPVFHVASDLNDRFIAAIEGVNDVEVMCKLYEVGRTKQHGDENANESEDSDDETEDEVDDHDDDDDDDDENEDDDNEDNDNDDDDDDQGNEISFEIEENIDEDDETNWLTTSDSSDDEALFSFNTSMGDR